MITNVAYHECFCGDLYCWWCGPEQGNYRCMMCNVWGLDGGCEDKQACAKAKWDFAEDLMDQLSRLKLRGEEDEDGRTQPD